MLFMLSTGEWGCVGRYEGRLRGGRCGCGGVPVKIGEIIKLMEVS